jgi:hypothetical protein
MMNPNSQHQMWSKWTWKITPPKTNMPSFGRAHRISRGRIEQVKTNIARFANKCFGTNGQMNVLQYTDGSVLVRVRVEGHPVHDPAYVIHVREAWDVFLRNGFGQRSTIEFSAKLEAGDVQDGKPADQMIILPPLQIGVEHS